MLLFALSLTLQCPAENLRISHQKGFPIKICYKQLQIIHFFNGSYALHQTTQTASIVRLKEWVDLCVVHIAIITVPFDLTKNIS